MIKLVVSDLDGTLLRNNETKLNKNIFAIVRKLTDQGVLFCVASGRPYGVLKRFFAPVSNDILYICENGAFVVYKGSVIAKNGINKEDGLKFLKEIQEHTGYELLISGQYTSYINPKTIDYVGTLKDEGITAMRVKDFLEIPEEILKISIYYGKKGEPDVLRGYEEKWNQKMEFPYEGAEWLEITTKGVNKGSALKKVMSQFSIEKEEVIAFGDNYNDKEMLAVSGHSYGVIGGKKEVLLNCQHITDSVEKILEDLFCL